VRPQVVQRTLNHILTERNSLFISQKFNQGCFSIDHCPPMTLGPCLFLLFSTVPTNSNLPTKSTGTWMRRGCLFIQDITVSYICHSAVPHNMWDNRKDYKWASGTGFELSMPPPFGVLYPVHRYHIRGIRPRPAIAPAAVRTILCRPLVTVCEIKI
jgi:hypothetical protein